MSEPFLSVSNVKKYFEINEGLFSEPKYVKAVDDVSFRMEKGEAISLVGESGSGKTTLGMTILRLHDATDGSIWFDGRDITNLSQKDLMWYRRKAALIQQDPFGALPSFMTIRRVLEEPLIIHKMGDREERRKRVNNPEISNLCTPLI